MYKEGLFLDLERLCEAIGSKAFTYAPDHEPWRAACPIRGSSVVGILFITSLPL